jgi:hypothetical protein
MILDRSSFVVRTAYAFGRIPERTSLCQLFWRFVLVGLLLSLWNVLKLIGFIIVCAANATFFIPGLFFGVKPVFHKPMWDPNTKQDEPLVLYERWPRVGGHRVIPAAVILAFVVGWKIGGSLMGVEISNPGYWVNVGVSFLVGAKYAAIIAAGVLTFIMGDRARRSETMQFLKAWLKAKKERVCPIVEIADLTPAGQ